MNFEYGDFSSIVKCRIKSSKSGRCISPKIPKTEFDTKSILFHVSIGLATKTQYRFMKLSGKINGIKKKKIKKLKTVDFSEIWTNQSKIKFLFYKNPHIKAISSVNEYIMVKSEKEFSFGDILNIQGNKDRNIENIACDFGSYGKTKGLY